MASGFLAMASSIMPAWAAGSVSWAPITTYLMSDPLEKSLKPLAIELNHGMPTSLGTKMTAGRAALLETAGRGGDPLH
jgi:hypothetical protein